MTPASLEDHGARYTAAKNEALKSIGRRLVGQGYVAIDDRGEVYWGGSFPATSRDCAELSKWLRVIAKDCDAHAKRLSP